MLLFLWVFANLTKNKHLTDCVFGFISVFANNIASFLFETTELTFLFGKIPILIWYVQYLTIIFGNLDELAIFSILVCEVEIIFLP